MMDDDGNGEVDLALVSAFHSLKNSLFFLSLYFDTRPMSSALQLILHRERLDVNTFMLKKYSLSAQGKILLICLQGIDSCREIL